MSACATGEAMGTCPELRTVPLILIGDRVTATVGVMVDTVTVKGWVALTGVNAGTAVTTVDALAGRTVEIGSTESERSEMARTVAELFSRQTCLRVLRLVTSRLPGAPMRPGRSAAHWET